MTPSTACEKHALIWEFVLTVLTVSNIILGGFIGYSGGRVIRPWYRPPAKSLSGGPRTVKCHSNKLSCQEEMPMLTWPQLLEGWITPSTREITIQWININKTKHAICWIVIYQVGSIIHLCFTPHIAAYRLIRNDARCVCWVSGMLVNYWDVRVSSISTVWLWYPPLLIANNNWQ